MFFCAALRRNRRASHEPPLVLFDPTPLNKHDSVMSPKAFYLTPAAQPDCLFFEPKQTIPLSSLSPGGKWGLPVSNSLAFRGPKWLFQFAMQRISSDGRRIEIASLMGSVSVPLDGARSDEPIGLICLYDEPKGFKDSAISRVGSAWAPVTEKAMSSMQVIALGDGRLAPLATSMTLRGMEGTLEQHFILLPAVPSSVKKEGSGALLKAEGMLFRLKDKFQAAAALNGKATWIVPDANGNFCLPA